MADFTITIEDVQETTLSIGDLTSLNVDENSTNGTEVGMVNATVSGSVDTPIYAIQSQSPTGAVNGNKIVIADSSIFDYETNPSITGVIVVTAGGVSQTANFTIAVNDLQGVPLLLIGTPLQVIMRWIILRRIPEIKM